MGNVLESTLKWQHAYIEILIILQSPCTTCNNSVLMWCQKCSCYPSTKCQIYQWHM